MKTTLRHKLGITLAGVMALIALPARVRADPPQYTVTVLGTLPGGTASHAAGINASGQVAGYSQTGDGNLHAVRWTGTTPEDLGTLGGLQSLGNGINASGQVTGYSYITPPSGPHAVRWTGTTPEDLGTLPGGSISIGSGINASGQVAGYSQPTTAVRWTGTTPTKLDPLPGGTASHAYAINDSGQVTGFSNRGNPYSHAVRWTGTTPTELGTLGSDSVGYAINASGQVAGISTITGQTGNHAVRWTGTTPEVLGTLGGTSSYGYGINDSGDVTGMSYLADNTTQHAFLYTGGTMYDLESLLWPGSGVSNLSIEGIGNNINGIGEIAATGTIGGETRALRLTPEPDTDGDGIRDRYETGTGIYVSPQDTGTSPTNPDTDGDGLNDGAEVNTTHSNPNLADTDGDGFNDGFEVSTGFDPLSAASTPDALSSIRTAAEYRFNAALGISYRIEASTDLANWTAIETNIIGAGGVITRFYSIEGQPKRFFRSRRN